MNNEMIFQGAAELQDLANAAMMFNNEPSDQDLEEMGFVKAVSNTQELEDCPF